MRQGRGRGDRAARRRVLDHRQFGRVGRSHDGGEAPAGLGNTGDPLFNRFWTLLGTPCIALPFNTGPFGLPLSVQLVGKHGSDDRLIAWARWIEARLT